MSAILARLVWNEAGMPVSEYLHFDGALFALAEWSWGKRDGAHIFPDGEAASRWARANGCAQAWPLIVPCPHDRRDARLAQMEAAVAVSERDALDGRDGPRFSRGRVLPEESFRRLEERWLA